MRELYFNKIHAEKEYREFSELFTNKHYKHEGFQYLDYPLIFFDSTEQDNNGEVFIDLFCNDYNSYLIDDIHEQVLNRSYNSLEWAHASQRRNSPPKPHAFVSLPLQSKV